MRLFRRRAAGAAEIRTARLNLVAITAPLLQMEETGTAALGEGLDAEVPATWPPLHWEPHVRAFIVLQYAEQPETLGWHRYVLLRRAGKGATLVGSVGAFPKLQGEAEIGYSVLPEFQRQGLASEAALALTEWLFTQRPVLSVAAQTYATMPESIKVMERCGMVPAGLGDDPGTVRYRRLR